MEGLEKLDKKLTQRKAVHKQYLHSPSHVLADELSVKLNDRKHFGYYLKVATTHDHQVLRGILGQVLEGKGVHSPGKLFTYLLKQADAEVAKNKTQT